MSPSEPPMPEDVDPANLVNLKLAEAPSERTRNVYFVVVSDHLSAEALAEGIGATPDASQTGTARFPNQATWELHAFGGPADDLVALVERVLERLRPLASSIPRLRADDPDLACVLRVVEYIGDDPVGPGFALGSSDITLLAEVGAFLDVDLYRVG